MDNSQMRAGIRSRHPDIRYIFGTWQIFLGWTFRDDLYSDTRELDAKFDDAETHVWAYPSASSKSSNTARTVNFRTTANVPVFRDAMGWTKFTVHPTWRPKWSGTAMHMIEPLKDYMMSKRPVSDSLSVLFPVMRPNHSTTSAPTYYISGNGINGLRKGEIDLLDEQDGNQASKKPERGHRTDDDGKKSVSIRKTARQIFESLQDIPWPASTDIELSSKQEDSLKNAAAQLQEVPGFENFDYDVLHECVMQRIDQCRNIRICEQQAYYQWVKEHYTPDLDQAARPITKECRKRIADIIDAVRNERAKLARIREYGRSPVN